MPRATPLTRRAFFAALVALAAALPAAPARAATPDFIELDETFVDEALSEFCGFPVQIHLQGKLILNQVHDATTTRGAGYHATYTNLENGATVTYRVTGVVFESAVIEDNLFIYEFSFSGGTKYVSPRHGAVVNTGRQTMLVVFDIETFQLLLFDTGLTGRRDGFTAEMLCEWLSD